MRRILVCCAIFFVSVQIRAAEPMAQRDACKRFSDAIVPIDAAGASLGTGFLVSADGYIITAGHVVTDQTTGAYFSIVEVTLPGGKHVITGVVSKMTLESIGQDYAILKVSGESNLPFLPLGSSSEAIMGSDITIIGFPFSAQSMKGGMLHTKFCLAGTVAASDLVTLPVEGTRHSNGQIIPIHADVKVDVIYFQCPSVKGISGGPVISRSTGHVIGIETRKLTGIGPELEKLKHNSSRGSGTGSGGVGDFGLAFFNITSLLDEQLANGLGAAVGIDDPLHALNMANRKK